MKYRFLHIPYDMKTDSVELNIGDKAIGLHSKLTEGGTSYNFYIQVLRPIPNEIKRRKRK